MKDNKNILIATGFNRFQRLQLFNELKIYLSWGTSRGLQIQINVNHETGFETRIK